MIKAWNRMIPVMAIIIWNKLIEEKIYNIN
jgi:hypothetical protein